MNQESRIKNQESRIKNQVDIVTLASRENKSDSDEVRDFSFLPAEVSFIDGGYVVGEATFDHLGQLAEGQFASATAKLHTFLRGGLFLDIFGSNHIAREEWLEKQNPQIKNVYLENRLSTTNVYQALQAIDQAGLGLEAVVAQFPDKKEKVTQFASLIGPLYRQLAEMGRGDTSGEWLTHLEYQAQLKVLAIVERIAALYLTLGSIRVEQRKYTLQNPKIALRNECERQGIAVFDTPRPDTDVPSQTLIRAERAPERLTESDAQMEAKAGEMGTQGVYFGDCLQPLVFPDQSGVYYAYDRDTISQDWLVYYGPEFMVKLKEAATKQGLDLAKIEGGVDAELSVFKDYPVYQPKRGIATEPRSVPVKNARRVFVTPDLATAHFLSQVVPDTLPKISVLH